MELSEYLTVLRKHWMAIALVGLLGGGAAYAWSSSLPPTYRATSSVWVTVQHGDSVGERVQGVTYADNRIESYGQLATKPYVLDPVIEELGLGVSPRALARTLTVSRPVNTQILEVTAVSGSPEQAAEVANAVVEALAQAVSDVEGDAAGESPSVQLTVVATAEPPAFAAGPNTRLHAATGLAAALALGVVLALARTMLDTRIRSARDARAVTAAAVLSTVRHDRRTKRAPLVMRDEPLGDLAEAYRRLRTNLRFLNLAGPSRSIMVTSSVPTEGKSTTAINLAIAMAEGSSRILLVDADLRKPSVARYLGVEGAVGLTTVLIGEATIDDVIQPWGDSFDVLPAGQVPPNPSELLDSEEMENLLRTLADRYDVVILDSAPLVPVTDSAALSRLVDGALVVVGCQVVHRHQLQEALASLAAVDGRVLGLVLNQVARREVGSTYVYGSTPRATAGRWAVERLRSSKVRAEPQIVGVDEIFPQRPELNLVLPVAAGPSPDDEDRRVAADDPRLGPWEPTPRQADAPVHAAPALEPRAEPALGPVEQPVSERVAAADRTSSGGRRHVSDDLPFPVPR